MKGENCNCKYNNVMIPDEKKKKNENITNKFLNS